MGILNAMYIGSNWFTDLDTCKKFFIYDFCLNNDNDDDNDSDGDDGDYDDYDDDEDDDDDWNVSGGWKISGTNNNTVD